MFDIVAIGELLIDFTPLKGNTNNDMCFSCKPGGAPANVMAAAQKLGAKTAFIGKVGNDNFGHYLKQTILNAGISSEGIIFDNEIPTTLAIVQLDERGDRSFSFYRKPGADIMLTPEEIPIEIIKQSKTIHFGSVSMTDEPSRQATIFAVEYAKNAGKLISFDPNFRPALWKKEEDALSAIKKALEYADIIKVSYEEMQMISGSDDLEEGSMKLYNYGASLVMVSLGENGAFYRCRDKIGLLSAYDLPTIDTNGAGDAFLGAVLYSFKDLNKEQIVKLQHTQLNDIIKFANAAGSLATTKSGAIPAMPSLNDIMNCINKEKLLIK